MTEKLYQTDSYLQELDTAIIESGQIEGRPAVVLDRTIFYPTSGGQMHDTGWLNDIPVKDVQIIDEKIWHLLDRSVTGERVHAKIDWQRRFDFMQQHTAFHLLAASLLHLRNIETLSSHLGEEWSSIDLDVAELDATAIQQVENDVNEILWQDHPVRPLLVTDKELEGMRVRKAPAVTGAIRLIEIEGIDLDPCGGTHVDSTAQVGLVKIIGRERIRKNVRLIFVAGRRTLRLLQKEHELCQNLANQFTTGIDDLSAAAGRLQDECKELRKRLRDQARVLAEFHLTALVSRAKEEKIVTQIFADLDMDILRWLASRAVKAQAGTYLLAATGERTSLIFASSLTGIDLRPFFNKVIKHIDGKGGGDAGFVQGSAAAFNDIADVLASAKAALMAVIG